MALSEVSAIAKLLNKIWEFIEYRQEVKRQQEIKAEHARIDNDTDAYIADEFRVRPDSDYSSDIPKTDKTRGNR